VSIVALSATLGVSIALLVGADDDGFVVTQGAGGRPRSASASWSTDSPG
jgi:hypothetical protein